MSQGPGSIELSGGVWHFRGFLNENVTVSAIKAAPGETLKLDLSELTAINSIGMRGFSQMIRAFGAAPIEIHKAPVCFVEAVNSVPSLVGGAQYGHRIRSLHVPYACPSCRATADVLTEASAVSVGPRGVSLPPAPCPRCRTAMTPSTVLDDYMMFLLYTA